MSEFQIRGDSIFQLTVECLVKLLFEERIEYKMDGINIRGKICIKDNKLMFEGGGDREEYSFVCWPWCVRVNMIRLYKHARNLIKISKRNKEKLMLIILQKMKISLKILRVGGVAMFVKEAIIHHTLSNGKKFKILFMRFILRVFIDS